MVPNTSMARSATCLGIMRMMNVIRARRAVQRLFCGFCAQELLSTADELRSYCSEGCANRDWACKSTALLLFSI